MANQAISRKNYQSMGVRVRTAIAVMVKSKELHKIKDQLFIVQNVRSR